MMRRNTDKSIAKATAYVLVVTIAAKIIGFVESALVAAFFGTSANLDMFYLANTIANRFIFTIFSGLAVVGLTLYNNARHNDPNKGDRFITALIIYMVPLGVLVTAIIYIAAPWVASIMAYNYAEEQQFILTTYLRDLSFISVFYVLTTILTCVLNANKRFLPGAFVGGFQNIIVIIFILILSEEIGVKSIVWGFVVAYVLQTLFLYFFASSVFKPRSCSLIKDIDIRRILILIFPLLIGEATAEVNTLVDQFLATNQGTGYVSGLSYSETLNDVVTSLFMQTITTVLLSYFSALAVKKQYAEMLAELKTIFKYVTLILIPISIITCTNADRIVSFVFERGNFDSISVNITSTALIGYALGFVFRTLMVIAKRPFFAIENTGIPMTVGIITVAINISLSIALSKIWGIFGITVSTSISYIIACIIYFILLSRSFKEMSWYDCIPFVKNISIASLFAIIITLSINGILPSNNFIALVTVTAICFLTYFGILYFTKTPELLSLKKKLIKK